MFFTNGNLKTRSGGLVAVHPAVDYVGSKAQQIKEVPFGHR